MFEKAIILGLYSVTPVHAGSGAELSVIDLPIQREKHTGFPVIWGQSLKGVLRNSFRRLELREEVKINDKSRNWEEKAKEIYGDRAEMYIKNVEEGRRDPPLTEIIFGPSTEAASEHAGAIGVGDAKILLFPVRSLKGVFAHVTCPLVLERFRRDLELLGIKNDFKVPQVNESGAVVSKDSSLKVDEKKIVLEDIVLSANDQDVSDLTSVIFKISPISIDEKRIAIVHDNVFSNLVQMTTEVVARVKIDAEKGTVQSGALWYEEYLPSDTLLYSVIAVGKPRKAVNGLSSAEDIIKEFETFNNKFVQIGGNETVGKGFVKLKVMSNENA